MRELGLAVVQAVLQTLAVGLRGPGFPPSSSCPSLGAPRAPRRQLIPGLNP